MPKQKFKQTINDWLESTSLRQLRNLPRAKNNFWKWFWIGVFAATLGAAIWQSVTIIKTYLQYNKDTIVQFDNAYNTPFPAVTICNLNPIKKSVGNYIQELKDLMTAYRYLSSLPYGNSTIPINASNNAAAMENLTSFSKRKKREADDEVFVLRYKRAASDITITSLTSPTADVSQGSCVFTTTSSTTSTSSTSTSSTSTSTSTEMTTTTVEMTSTSIIPTTTFLISTSTEEPTAITSTKILTTSTMMTDAPTISKEILMTSTPEVATTSIEIPTTSKESTTSTKDSATTAAVETTAFLLTKAPTSITELAVTTTDKLITTTDSQTTKQSTEVVTTGASTIAAEALTTTQKFTTTQLATSPAAAPTTTKHATTNEALTTTLNPTSSLLISEATSTKIASTNLLQTSTVVIETSTPKAAAAITTAKSAFTTALITIPDSTTILLFSTINKAASTSESPTTLEADTTKQTTVAKEITTDATQKGDTSNIPTTITSDDKTTAKITSKNPTTIMPSSAATQTSKSSSDSATSVKNNSPITSSSVISTTKDSSASSTTQNGASSKTNAQTTNKFISSVASTLANNGATSSSLSSGASGKTTDQSTTQNSESSIISSTNNGASLLTIDGKTISGFSSSPSKSSTNYGENTPTTLITKSISSTDIAVTSSDDGGSNGLTTTSSFNSEMSTTNSLNDDGATSNSNNLFSTTASNKSGRSRSPASTLLNSETQTTKINNGDSEITPTTSSSTDEGNGDGSGSGDDGNGSGDDDNNNGSGSGTDDGSGDGIDNGNGNSGDGSGDNDNGSGDNDDGSGEGNGDGSGDGGGSGGDNGLGSGDGDGDGDGNGNGGGGNGNNGNVKSTISSLRASTPFGNGLTPTNSNDNDERGKLTTKYPWTNFPTTNDLNNGDLGSTKDPNGGGGNDENQNGFSTSSLFSGSSKSLTSFLTTTTTNPSNQFTTVPSNSGTTTTEPIVFEGYTQSEINALVQKYQFQLGSGMSRVTLESQTQDKMMSIVNENANASYSLRELVISCAYNLVPCDYKNDFVTLTDPDFGNCYTYNYNAKHLIVRAGKTYGLRMIAFSNVSEYLATSSKSGMRVVVHKQDFAPFPNTEGINAGVGTYVNINVQYNNIERLGKPYGDCHPENNTSEYIYPGFYTYEGCFRTCYQQQIIDACNCADPRFPQPKEASYSWCAVANATLFTCYENYLLTYGDFSNVSNCECSTGCSEPGYNLEVTTAVWPGNITNYTTPMCWGKYPGTPMDCYTAYHENAVYIDVSFNRMVNERTYERPSISSMDLFHQISGAIALWTGVSMLIFAEIVEVLWFGIFPPNISSRVSNIDKLASKAKSVGNVNGSGAAAAAMSNASNGFYDSNMAAEYANDVPQPFSSQIPGIGLIAGLPAAEYMSKTFGKNFDNIEDNGFKGASEIEPKFCFD